MKIEFHFVYLITPNNNINRYAMSTEIKKGTRVERVAGVINTISKLNKEYFGNLNKDCLMIVVHNNDLDIAEALLKKGVRSEHVMDTAIHTTNLHAVELLLQYGVIANLHHIQLATLYGLDDIVEAINKKITENPMFQFDLDF